MSKHYLSKKEIKALVASLEEIGLPFADADKMQVEESKNGNMYFLGRVLAGVWTESLTLCPSWSCASKSGATVPGFSNSTMQ